MLGVGGGIVIVPVLYHVFTLLGIDEAVRMHLAVGTSLGTIVLTSIRSVRAHAKKAPSTGRCCEAGQRLSWSASLQAR